MMENDEELYMNESDDDELYSGLSDEEIAISHYGTPKHSGRYPWGSGDEPFQRSGDFLSRVDELKKSGLKEVEIAEALGMSSTDLRSSMAIAKNERRSELVARARSLEDDGVK